MPSMGPIKHRESIVVNVKLGFEGANLWLVTEVIKDWPDV